MKTVFIDNVGKPYCKIDGLYPFEYGKTISIMKKDGDGSYNPISFLASMVWDMDTVRAPDNPDLGPNIEQAYMVRVICVKEVKKNEPVDSGRTEPSLEVELEEKEEAHQEPVKRHWFSRLFRGL